jgi:hypothetical protein
MKHNFPPLLIEGIFFLNFFVLHIKKYLYLHWFKTLNGLFILLKQKGGFIVIDDLNKSKIT